MSEIETVQSDVTFSGSYARRPLELGKLMLYQLSYSRSMTYGWWGLQVSESVSIQDPVKRVYHSTQRVGLEVNVAAGRCRDSA
jgi:hypothetical protein